MILLYIAMHPIWCDIYQVAKMYEVSPPTLVSAEVLHIVAVPYPHRVSKQFPRSNFADFGTCKHMGTFFYAIAKVTFVHTGNRSFLSKTIVVPYDSWQKRARLKIVGTHLPGLVNVDPDFRTGESILTWATCKDNYLYSNTFEQEIRDQALNVYLFPLKSSTVYSVDKSYAGTTSNQREWADAAMTVARKDFLSRERFAHLKDANTTAECWMLAEYCAKSPFANRQKLIDHMRDDSPKLFNLIYSDAALCAMSTTWCNSEGRVIAFRKIIDSLPNDDSAFALCEHLIPAHSDALANYDILETFFRHCILSKNFKSTQFSYDICGCRQLFRLAESAQGRDVQRFNQFIEELLKSGDERTVQYANNLRQQQQHRK